MDSLQIDLGVIPPAPGVTNPLLLPQILEAIGKAFVTDMAPGIWTQSKPFVLAIDAKYEQQIESLNIPRLTRMLF